MRLRPALAALSATALLGLAACGGSDGDSTATGSTSGSSAAAPSSSAAESGSADDQTTAFCTEGQDSLDQFDDQLDAAGPEGLATILPQVVDAIDALDPPAAVADSVQTLRDAYDQLAQAAAANDLSTPEGQQAFQDAYAQIQPTAQPAEDALEQWTDANCPGDDAAPTS
jgi:predicted RNA-binding Zn ribbon-like protein